MSSDYYLIKFNSNSNDNILIRYLSLQLSSIFIRGVANFKYSKSIY